MDDITRIIEAAGRGDTQAAEALLPVAYAELRRLAASKLASERTGHTLQPTALVHEAYLKLLGPQGDGRDWNGREHFFAAAADAMRKILIDSARRKRAQKRGGDFDRVTWAESQIAGELPSDDILVVDAAIKKLEESNADLARLVKLRYFAGLSIDETASALGVSPSSVDRSWRGARAWLFREISNDLDESS